MLRRLLSLFTLTALTASGLVAAQVSLTDSAALNRAQAVTGSDFRAGNIISDENFYNGNAMTLDEVKAFLESKVSPSQGTGNALVNYGQVTPSLPATASCDAYEGSPGGESPASIIWKVGRACHISQAALIVLLEKEQSLITDPAPSNRQLTAATGFSCPDDAPCDPSFGGFFYQVYNAGRQFQYYRHNPYEFNYIAGQTTNIQYNPDASCGSSPVLIENDATAGLYDYTPYQPNASALWNFYGEGDGCATYGNRNFFRIYSDWFGDPHGAPMGTTDGWVRADGGRDIYLVTNGKRHYLPFDVFQEVPNLTVHTISQSKLDAMPKANDLSRVVMDARQRPHVFAKGKMWDLLDCVNAADVGTPCDQAATMSDAVMATFDRQGPLGNVAKQANGVQLIFEKGVRREVPDLSILDALGVAKDNREVPNEAFNYLREGAPLAAPGNIVKNAVHTEDKVLVDGMKRHKMSAEIAGLGWVNDAAKTAMTPSAITQYQSADTIETGFLKAGSVGYVVTDRGIARVDRATLGATPGTWVSEQVVGRLPRTADLGSAFLMRSAATQRVALVDNGSAQVFGSEDEAKRAAAAKHVATAVTTVPDALFTAIPTSVAAAPTAPATAAPTTSPTATPDASPAPGASSSAAPAHHAATAKGTSVATETVETLVPGEVVTNAEKTATWIVNGDQLLQVATPGIAADLGLKLDAPKTVNATTLRSYVGRFSTLYAPIVSCNGIDAIGIGGELRGYETDAVKGAYQLKHVALDSGVCAKLSMSAVHTINTTEVQSEGGERYCVEQGKLVALGTAATGVPAADEARSPTGTAPARAADARHTAAATLLASVTPSAATPAATPAAPAAGQGAHPMHSGTPGPAATSATSTPTPSASGTPRPTATGRPTTTATGAPVARSADAPVPAITLPLSVLSLLNHLSASR